MTFSEKVKEAKKLEVQFKREYANENYEVGSKIEKEFLQLRLQIIDSVNENINRFKSIPLSVVRERVNQMKRPVPIETGIKSLDRELVGKDAHKRGDIGGFPLGNLIQIAGAKGAGKTTILLKMLSNFSLNQKVSWMNFEMSDMQVIDKIDAFNANENNVLYYTSSRELSEIANEIKYLNASGVKHFVIDSNMKINVSNASSFEKDSKISNVLKELTSVLDINIYMINQMSKENEKNNELYLKGGNDTEYDSDMILFILKAKLLDANDKPKVDELGAVMFDENIRFIKCTKNRIFDNRLFLAKIEKSELFGVEVIREMEYVNDDIPNFDNVDMPRL